MKVKYGMCVECKVRDNDSSEKELYKCPHCGRFFCVEHFEPKPVHIRDYSLYSKYPEFWVAIQKETEVEDRHPCFQFTKIWVEEKDQELRLEKKLLIDWLDKSKAYRPRRRKVPLGTCPRCFRSERTGLIETTKYDAKTMTFTCLGCGHRWTQLKAFPHDIVENSIKHVSYGRHQRKSQKKKIVIIVIGLLCIILIGYWFYPQYFKVHEYLSTLISGLTASMETEEPKIDIRKEIEILNSKRGYYEKYSIREYNWKVWKKQWEATGGTLIEMESWDEFKESLRQNSFVYLLMLDEENRVIWYRPTSTSIVYFQY